MTPERLAKIKERLADETHHLACHRQRSTPDGATCWSREYVEDVGALVAEVERLRGALEAARRPHLGSEYDEYACPLGHGAEYVTDATGQCTCGASAHNARIDAALSCEDAH